jgi:hypothetical protein
VLKLLFQLLIIINHGRQNDPSYNVHLLIAEPVNTLNYIGEGLCKYDYIKGLDKERPF